MNVCTACNGKNPQQFPPGQQKRQNNVLTGNAVQRGLGRIKEARKTNRDPTNKCESVQKQIMAIECIRYRQYQSGRWQKSR